MPYRDPSDYKFKFIEFKELDIIKRERPGLYENASSRLLLSCPDVFKDFPCYFYLLDNDNNIVCSVKAFPDRLVTSDKTYPWAWLGALLTDERYRGKGLATILISECEKILHKKGIAWGGVFSTDIALRIYRKLGFTIPGYANRYLFLKSARPFLVAHVRSIFLSSFLNILYMGATRFLYKACFSNPWFRKRKSRKLMFTECDENNYTSYHKKINYSTTFHFNDSQDKLIWKIRGCKSKSGNICKLFIARDLTTNDIVGYFVVRNKIQKEPVAVKYKNFTIMTLMDYGLFIDDEAIYSSIIENLFDLFWKSSAEVLEVISNSEALCAVLRRKGMLRVGKGMSFKFSLPEFWNIGDECSKLEEWHLTHFCGDGFSF